MLQVLLAKERESAGVCTDQRGNRADCRELESQGISAAMIHGDRSQSQRTTALTGSQQGRFRVLVATTASRGIPRAGHRARHQLRFAGGGGEFYPPRWANGTQRRHGVASTLFVKEQRSELFHLERSLGIQDRADARDETTTSLPEKQERTRSTHLHFRIAGQSTFPALNSARASERFVAPAKFSRRSSKTKQVQSRGISTAPTKSGPVCV